MLDALLDPRAVVLPSSAGRPFATAGAVEVDGAVAAGR